jgi:Leucine Rich repeat
MLPGPPERSWRRCLRLSVRGLIVLVLVVGAGLGWVVRSARIQRDAVAAITRGGGSVIYTRHGWNTEYTPFYGPGKTPTGLVETIGVDYFRHVTSASLNRGPTDTDGDATLAQVRHFNRLQALRIDGASVSDAGLAQVRDLTELWLLFAGRTQITDAGLVNVKNLRELEALWLEQTQVTDAGLAHLKELRNLTGICLDGTRVSGAGLAHLEGLPKLFQLFLCKTNVNDDGLAHLRRLTKLSRVELANTQVTDAGLAHLKGLTRLAILDLRGTQITDSGLVHLKTLTGLTDLDLRNTKVSEAGIKALEQALPNVKILHGASGAPRLSRRGGMVLPTLPGRYIKRWTGRSETKPTARRG